MVLPKAEKAPTLVVAQRITRLSGCSRKDVLMVAVPVASLIRQPLRLNAVADTFLNSMYSALGKPTGGAGSAMISEITTSNRLAGWANESE